MSPLKKTTSFSKPQILISTTFIVLFTFIFLLNFPLTSNFLYSTSFFSTYITTVSSTGIQVEYESGLSSPPPRNTCDIFDGTWVDDDLGPIYAPGECNLIGTSFNCFRSGRPDLGYLNYRWQPYNCDIPRFDGRKMIEMLRGKRMVFVGDSLNRNMWESLLCSLGSFGIYGKKSLTRDGATYAIKEYDCSITCITAPFLVRHWRNSGEKARREPIDKLKLDEIHDTVGKYYNADFLIFNTGQWWSHGFTKEGKNFFLEGDAIHEKLDLEEAYTKALTTWGNWVDRIVSISKNKTKVFFVGVTSVHFIGGEWNSNGTCDEAKEPIKDTEQLKGQVLDPYRPWTTKTPELIMSKMKTPVIYLNISRLTDYRKDGHPSKYRRPHFKPSPGMGQDCMHWCLPGVPDSWNQLLYASLLSMF